MHNSSSSNTKAISNSVKHPDFTSTTVPAAVQDSWTDNISDNDDDDNDDDLEDIFTMSTSESSNPDEESAQDDTESLYCDALSRKASLVNWPLEKTKSKQTAVSLK